MSAVTMPDLIRSASFAGKAFGWGPKYVDLLITSAGAVYRAEGLDEAVDPIPVDKPSVVRQVTLLKGDLISRGMSTRTVSSYSAGWKRLAKVTDRWVTHGRPGFDDERFWNELVGDLTDKRVRRRVGRSRPAIDPVAVLGGSREIVVPFSDRTKAVVSLPAGAGEREVLAVIEVLAGSIRGRR